MSSSTPNPVAVVGSGPAGLMAAWVIASAGHAVTLFEKKSGAGRKLLVAGSSGLNITYEAPRDEFLAHYRDSADLLAPSFDLFGPAEWREFIHGLGIETFCGTSRRWFVEGMKGAELLAAWTARLRELSVRFELNQELTDVLPGPELRFGDETPRKFAAAVLALGGGSWEKQDVRWPEILRRRGVGFAEFAPSNAGFEVEWPAAFLKEAEGLPIKNIALHSPKGMRHGELVVTRYGLEGTPVYAAGVSGRIEIDLKPAWTEAEILSRMSAVRENLSPIRRAKKQLNLGDGALALLFHLTPKADLADAARLARAIKHFPLTLRAPRPLSESISSSGGLKRGELDPRTFALRKLPGVFAAGEMLDWDAPTGGFLIQACVSTGFLAGKSVVESLQSGPLRLE